MSAKFGKVTVDDDGKISFPAQKDLTIRQAEDFWSHLISSILYARDVVGDPL